MTDQWFYIQKWAYQRWLRDQAEKQGKEESEQVAKEEKDEEDG